MSEALEQSPWEPLRQFTRARIALGRAGHGVPTAPLLAFNLSHAQARDAVHQPLDVPALRQRLDTAGFASFAVDSAASDREQYLRRPDLGRRLCDTSREAFAPLAAACAAGVAGGATRDIAPGIAPDIAPDIVFVLADGLSALAVMRHAVPLLEALRRRLDGWRIGPVVVARHARVALGDEIGERLAAPLLAILIGERPGLSSPDSLGVYLTHAPRVGCNDAQRNCVSNVRPEGLGYEAAAHKLQYLLTHARQRGLTGVALKDDSEAPLAVDGGSPSLR
ncbi:ethanolamine ammonia-lyase subunit EutC [Robbsia sp. Bb-Pol-6]|uniref:Ethanolamine ammonia-lyase small subunit n=1 Tax=Robbsia betulipollinis TaxID=2981849 RepID=A0ABT3ZQC9_9BURK|nr:ethanolamine ammonia-lyase subunit EutC [Robbsia betulipollinis]MCY0388751.1 ethanolamine ammonia-lyase subunit EutC [Robbsia betulipollinis]